MKTDPFSKKIYYIKFNYCFTPPSSRELLLLIYIMPISFLIKSIDPLQTNQHIRVIVTWIFTIVLFQACIVFSLVRKSRTNQPTYIIICVNKKHTPPSPRGFLLLICLCRRCRTNQPTFIRVNKRKHIPSSSRRLIYSRSLSFFVGSGGSALTK